MKTITDIIKNGCCIFTMITLLFYSVGGIISGSEQEFIPSLKFIWLFFVFSLLLAAANIILKSKKINTAAKLAIHFAASAAVYFVTVVVCGGYINNGAQTVIALSLFLVLYLIFAVVYLIATRKRCEPKKYEKMFK
ncbi:MAG: DUF3021 family protein [Clostridia bacterium]|nr:DUF3021 family protein [Clostridia bacterium]